MAAALILVILTATSAGGVSAAFVNDLDAAACKERGENVRAILESGNVEILELGCFRGTAKFEKFVHGTPPDAPRHSYRITLKDDNVTVVPVKDVASCKAESAPKADQKNAQEHCVTSTQKMLRKSAWMRG